MVKPDHSDHLSTIDGDIFVNSFDGLFCWGRVRVGVGRGDRVRNGP